jgi:hypothetical protein
LGARSSPVTLAPLLRLRWLAWSRLPLYAAAKRLKPLGLPPAYVRRGLVSGLAEVDPDSLYEHLVDLPLIVATVRYAAPLRQLGGAACGSDNGSPQRFRVGR